MMPKTEDIAKRLVQAFRKFETIELAEADRPSNMTEAEAIEDAVIAGLGPIAAWKLGATHSSGLAKTGLPRFFLGALPASRVSPAGGRVTGNWRDTVGVECEYAFCFARDFAPGDTIDRATVMAGIAGVHAAFEIPATRYTGRLGSLGGFCSTADDGLSGWLVVGPEIASGTPGDLGDRPVKLLVGDTVVSEGDAASRIDRFAYDRLTDFVELATSRGHTVRKGHYVVPGSCTGCTQVPLGKLIRADFAGTVVEAVFEGA